MQVHAHVRSISMMERQRTLFRGRNRKCGGVLDESRAHIARAENAVCAHYRFRILYAAHAEQRPIELMVVPCGGDQVRYVESERWMGVYVCWCAEGA
jgi:hypothetical protein